MPQTKYIHKEIRYELTVWGISPEYYGDAHCPTDKDQPFVKLTRPFNTIDTAFAELRSLIVMEADARYYRIKLETCKATVRQRQGTFYGCLEVIGSKPRTLKYIEAPAEDQAYALLAQAAHNYAAVIGAMVDQISKPKRS